MMVVLISTEAIDRLAVVTSKDVNDLFFLETLERPINRGQSYALSLSRYELMYFLRAGKTTCVF